jgi:prepilin-type processing-associated H-X9-DG protein
MPLTEQQWDRVPDNPMDYVASAFPIPYSQRSLTLDNDSDLVWEDNADFQGEIAGNQAYIPTSKIEDFPADVNPASIIYVTEAHTSLDWKGVGPRYHHMFLASQLPLANHPRMASDQRHPGGLNALFFDGHAVTMDIHRMDPGYPNTRDKRLRYFTVMPDWWEPAP